MGGGGGRPTPGRPAGRPTGEGAPRPRLRGWIPASAGMTEKRAGMTGEGTEGRGWKVPDGCARRRRRLYRCVLSATADVPHRRRLCDSPASERMRRRREKISVWGSLDHQKCPTIRRYGGVDLDSVAGWNELSESYDGGVSGHNGPVEQHDTVLEGVA